MSIDGGRTGQLASSGLRPGWTTGACATAASRAAFLALHTGEFPDPVTVLLPQGRRPAFALTRCSLDPGRAHAEITKDAGDDPDITHGAVVTATLSPGPPGSRITFRAGAGVGTVTLPGLPLPVGQPAINPVPRTMITENLTEAAAGLGVEVGDLIVEIGIIGGEELARRTLNPRLGILGGLSVLGTTGVVVPYSCSAWIDSIRRGVDVARAAGLQHLAATTGSTSEAVVRELYGLPELALLDMGDFAGAVLKYLARHPVQRLTICGGIGKLAKLADGHLDLHSARSSVDLALLARLAGQVGADADLQESLVAAGTALGAVRVAQAAGVPLGGAIAAAAREQALAVLRGSRTEVEVIGVDRAGLILGRSPAQP